MAELQAASDEVSKSAAAKRRGALPENGERFPAIVTVGVMSGRDARVVIIRTSPTEQR